MRCYVNMRVQLDYASLTSPPPPPLPSPQPHLCFSCCYGFLKVTTTSHDSRVKTPPGMPLDRIQKKKERKATLGRSRCIQLIVNNVINIITAAVIIIFFPSSPMVAVFLGPIQSCSSFLHPVIVCPFHLQSLLSAPP